ncbi:MAG: HD domain-containing phosphohydrolase [Duganella sp.]
MNRPVILIVDDEPANLAIMRDILGQLYQLVFARNGTETLAALKKHAPAMVLLDVGLPDINGYALCADIKHADPTGRVQVIFITAYTDPVHEAAGFDAGGVDYIAKPVSPRIVRARVANHLSLVRAGLLAQSYRDAILMLGQAGHFNDTDTGAHIWRMAAYARTLALASGWSTEDSEQLELAAPMHDTGKIGIPQSILRKPGPLDDAEWLVMKTHPQIGYDILSKSDAPVFQLAAQVALYHHEKWDGSGYPAGLAGEQIPQSARIVALADVFDALSMERPYKQPWSVAQITGHIDSGAGTHFDPALVELFRAVLPALLDIRSQWNADGGAQSGAGA